MAVRFIQPIDTPYESQFVPMPLDFMYKNLQEKQKGLDESRAAIAKIDPKINYAPWDEALAQQYKERFAQEARDLAASLEQNKDDYSSVVSRVGELNRKFTTDPELSRILRHAEAWKTNVEPSLKDPEAATAYFATLKNPDGTWKSGNQIKDEDIVAPIFNKVEAQVDKELLPFLTESVREVYKDAVPQINPNTGQIEYVRPDGVKITDLNLDNPFILDAIDKYSKRWLEGNEAQHLYLKEKLGINTFEGIRDFMRGIASKKFFSKTDVLPGSPVSSGGNSRSVNTNTSKQDNIYSVDPLTTLENIFQVNTADLNSTEQQVRQLEAEGDSLSLDIIQFATQNPNLAPTIIGSLTKSDKKFDEIISNVITTSNLDPVIKEDLRRVMATSSSAIDLIALRGLEIFNPNSEFYKSGGVNPELATQFKKAANASLVGLTANSTSNEEAAYLSRLNETVAKYQSEQETLDQKTRIYNASVNTIAKKLNIPSEEVSNLSRGYNIFQSLKDEYTTLGITDPIYKQDIDRDPRLQELVKLGFLSPGTDTPGRGRHNLSSSQTNRYFFFKLPEAEKIVPQVEQEYNKTYTETLTTVRELSNTGTMATAQKSQVEMFNNNLDYLYQIATASAKGDGKSYLNKPTLGEIFASSPLKKDNFDATAPFTITDVVYKADNYGMPTLVVTAANTESGKPKDSKSFSTIVVDMADTNLGLVATMTEEMIADDDEKVQEVGTAWLATQAMDKSNLSLAALYFNSFIPGSKTSFEPITVKTKTGNQYTLTHLSSGNTILTINGRNAEEVTTDANKRINPTDIRNFQTFAQYVGAYELHGSRGGASNPQNFQRPQNGERR